ncbi:hypothetical protein HDU87_006898 [Geranomyces variabilis]|uniref:Ankyrin n=1 Tax=Geranomyces variabilis TaxID=109894 RepID=A0AAD5XNP9_9FUNG|nr:hypothetical protein HDU87_006898 [Geranomyces variabilis]
MPALVVPQTDNTNVWIAAADGRIDLVEHFLKTGGPNGTPLSPNVKDDSGYTPLHAAAAYSNILLIDLLVSTYGSDVNITDEDGDTPLHVCETVEAARRLKELGADTNLKNDDGKRAIDSAYEEERDDIVEYLKEFCPDFAAQPREDSDASTLAHTLQERLAESGLAVEPTEGSADSVTVSLEQIVAGLQNGTISAEELMAGMQSGTTSPDAAGDGSNANM